MSRTAVAAAWESLGGDPGRLANVEVRGAGLILPSPLPVGELAVACVSSALLAAAELAHARGLPRPRVSLDAAHVQASFTSERHARLEGRPLGPSFGALSTWLRAADGWLRSHGNYPHHRAALLRALGVDSEDLDTVRAAAARLRARELEEAIFSAGGCAGALRDRASWDADPQGRALAGLGLLDVDHGQPGAAPLPGLHPGELPAAGVRVLDLTRVIAGPVAGRTLAALGAEVVRIDAPAATELANQVMDTGPGKRSATLDLRLQAQTFHSLLAEADVLIQGYRPGALEALGFGAAELARRYPNLVTVNLSAWGETGPWGDRRGFDSLVQSATGIAVHCTTADAEAPGALPAQALDHGTGHLMAAAALLGLAARTRDGRTLHARLALARTAAWLLDLPRTARVPQPAVPLDPASFLIELPSPEGLVTLVAPPGELDERPLRWARGPEPIGSSAAAWSTSPSA
jgi:CoA-transferase family III